jgi:hypothetical protein
LSFSSALCLEPDYVDVAGQPRARKGKPLEYVAAESYWSHAFDMDSDEDIEVFLSSLVDSLEGHRGFFEDVIAGGGRAELFIGFFVDAFNCGFVLSSELQRRCAVLGLDLSFDVYGLIPEKQDA